MNKVNEVLRSIKFVRIGEFNNSLGVTKQLIATQIKSCEEGKIIKSEYYKKAQKELIRIYNLIVDAELEPSLDKNDERFSGIFKMNLLRAAKDQGLLPGILSALDEIDTHLTTMISKASEGEAAPPSKKRDSQATKELETPISEPVPYDQRVKNFLAKTIR